MSINPDKYFEGIIALLSTPSFAHVTQDVIPNSTFVDLIANPGIDLTPAHRMALTLTVKGLISSGKISQKQITKTTEKLFILPEKEIG